MNVQFPKPNYSLQGKLSSSTRNVSYFLQDVEDERDEITENMSSIFSFSSKNQRIFAMNKLQYKNPNDYSVETPLDGPDIDSGLTDIPTIPSS